MQENRLIRTKDGKEISAICYLSGETTGKVIIIGPSASVTQKHYCPLAKLFRRLGYDVITFDYRGVGLSVSENQVKDASLHQWAVQDADAVIRYARVQFPGKELIYMGHGVGGEIIGLAQASQYINRLVLVNSALSCKKLWPAKDKMRIWMLKAVLNFSARFSSFWPGRRLGFVNNLPQGVIFEWANWCNSPNGLFDRFPDSNFQKLQIPVLAFSFSDDWRCPPRAVSELLNHFCGAAITWHHLRPEEMRTRKIGHAGFFDPAMKGTLWVMLDRWLNSDHRRDENIVDRQAIFDKKP